MIKKFFLIILFIYEYLQQSEVYYTKNISSQGIVEMFKKLNITLPGRVGIKVHTGEIGGAYFLRPDFLQPIYDYLNGTFIECNTAYTSYGRHTTELHQYTLKRNGWLDNDRRTVIMDENPDKDFNLSIGGLGNENYFVKFLIICMIMQNPRWLYMMQFFQHRIWMLRNLIKNISIH